MSTLEFIFGVHAVHAMLRKHPENVLTLWVVEGRDKNALKSILNLAKRHKISVQSVSRTALDERFKDQVHQGVVAECKTVRISKEKTIEDVLEASESTPLILILEGIQDPHNLGACLRSAEAAGVTAVIIPKDNTCGITPTVQKVACGAASTLEIIHVGNLSRELEKLKELGIWITGTAGEGAESLYEVDFTGPMAIVMGAEGKGLKALTQKHCDYLVHIPMVGDMESLNVSVATGVCLFEAVRQRGF